MPTLLISDLHIGAGNGRPLLDDEAVIDKLADQIAEYDRLVLLGDVIEMRELGLRDALAAASRVLPKLVRGMRPDAQVLLLAGNHDHELLAPYFLRRAASAPPPPLGLDEQVDWVDGEPLAAMASYLESSGASVSVHYPGVWLREDVYAHHGHFLDVHTTTPAFERLFAGVMAKLLKMPLNELASVEDYERILAPIYAWMFAVTQSSDREVDSGDSGASMKVLGWLQSVHGPASYALDFGLRATFAAVGAIGLGALSGDLSAAQLTRAGVRGFEQALGCLDLSPTYALFGHTHRAGPLPGDDRLAWTTESGTQMMNSGCWVHERLVPDAERPSSPYRAGFAIELDESGPPRVVNLLER